ncbi:MAG: hypothetical protein ABI831_28465 [Betaproteobacteria bacterium]
MPISSLKVETWTRDEVGAATNGDIQCTLSFNGWPPLVTQLNNPGLNDFRQGAKDFFNVPVDAAHHGANPNDITGIKLKNLSPGRKWIPGAVGLSVNGLVLLSRVVLADLPPKVIHIPRTNDNTLQGLEVRIRTADVRYASSDDIVYCTVWLRDGRQIISDLLLSYPAIDEFERGDEQRYLLPLPDPLWGATFSDVDKIALRKTGSNGWLLGGVSLRANGRKVIENLRVDQFLDNDPAVLYARSWSSDRILGPVLGSIGSSVARIQYRVEKPGKYLVRATDRTDGSIAQGTGLLDPAGVIELTQLNPERTYDFSLVDPDGNDKGAGGTFSTSPDETKGCRFAFAFGSCLRNKYDSIQRAWPQIQRFAYSPSLNPPRSIAPLRFFVHVGDTFYFYDADVLASGDVKTAGNVGSAARAANLSSRLNPNFLAMARVLPSVAVWDDHDFRGNNSDGTDFPDAASIRDEYLRYWGNPDVGLKEFGLATRVSYGRADLYIMDGRFCRNKGGPVPALFSVAQCKRVLAEIDSRHSRLGPRICGLASGSVWNATSAHGNGEGYNDPRYAPERKFFFKELRTRMDAGIITGLFFLSGDIHRHEVFEVSLGGDRVAPEFVSSPLAAPHSDTSTNSITGERKFSQGADREDGLYAGFAMVTIDTSAPDPNKNWTLRIDYRRHDDGALFFSHQYTLDSNQFKFQN